MSILESDLIGMSLEQEGLVITFNIISRGILLEGTASKDVVMFALDNVKRGLLIANQSLEIGIRELLLWTSVQQLQREVNTIKPTLE
jgi:hypothetical protein